MLSRASGKLLRKRTWKGWVHKQGLSCVKSRITEAAAQARAKSPPCPKTYSWTAAVSLLGKSVIRISTCVCEETRNQRRLTLGLLCARKKISCDKKNLLHSHAASTWIPLHAHRDMFLRKDCCEFAPPNRLMHTIMPHFRHGGTLGSQSARKKTWISIHDQGSRFMRLKTAAFSRCGRTWISLRAQ